jgi:hypothetical protein
VRPPRPGVWAAGVAPSDLPRHNLPRQHPLHPELWKKEPARLSLLGCSWASAGPAAALAAPLDSRFPVTPRSLAAPGTRLGARSWGELRSGMRQAPVALAQPGLPPTSSGCDPHSCSCRWRGRRSPHSPFAIQGGVQRPRGNPLPQPLLVHQAGGAERPGVETQHRDGGALPRMGGGGNRKVCPLLSCSGHLVTEIRPRGVRMVNSRRPS